jgi:hypothetical protein
MTGTGGFVSTRIAGGHTLLAVADGRTVQAAAATPIALALGGKAIRVVTLPLGGLAAGDYELRLSVEDRETGRTLAALERFSIEGDEAEARGE